MMLLAVMLMVGVVVSFHFFGGAQAWNRLLSLAGGGKRRARDRDSGTADVQVYRFQCAPTACQRARNMNGHQFEVEPGRKLFPVRCGQVDCGCHYRRLASEASQNLGVRLHRSGAIR